MPQSAFEQNCGISHVKIVNIMVVFTVYALYRAPAILNVSLVHVAYSL